MFYIGTSGWAYSHWREKFYPKSLSPSKQLMFYTQKFNSVEINYSFYHLPKKNTYQKWLEEVSEKFIFAVKVSRFITHIKRLKDIRDNWQLFYSQAQLLKNKLGPFLLQMPPNFLFNEENFRRVEEFLMINFGDRKSNLRLAIEFRHSSWSNQEIFELLQKYNTALVISDSSRWPKIIQPDLADFIYLRFHGPRELFASNYSLAELKNWAKKIKKWGINKDIFIYFNNDFSGFAPKNAIELQKIMI